MPSTEGISIQPGAALKKLGVKSVSTDIEDNVIVERDEFESARGISTLPTSASARSMWKTFFEIGREVAPSVIIPEEMSGHHVRCGHDIPQAAVHGRCRGTRAFGS
ncbi:hypothetical protein [Rhizobium leguminosarum]|uniref:hypothetical protein n=1 Tax=Rhizobium leguminosarum TaxID=384 RepID=UPI0012DB07E3|nr:hypothetical protein [Rhizobium leguminosarum]